MACPAQSRFLTMIERRLAPKIRPNKGNLAPRGVREFAYGKETVYI